MTRPNRSGSVSLAVALVLSLVLHGAYFYWAAPGNPDLIPHSVQREQPEGKGLQLISLSGSNYENLAMDALNLYSPAVFAFPTPVGFSASLLKQTLRTPPPRLPRTLDDSGLTLHTRSALSPEVPARNDPAASRRFDLPLPEIPQTRRGPFSVAAVGADTFVARVPDSWPTPTLLPEKLWTGTIALTLAPNGQVQQALVTRHSETLEDPSSWAKWAYGIKFLPGTQSETGNLKIQWIPPGTQEGVTP